MATTLNLISYTNSINLNLIDTTTSTSIDVIDVSRNITAEIITAAATGSDKNFVFTQSTLSTSWVIEHDLDKYPAVEIVSTAHDKIVGSVSFDSVNQITINFTQPTSGKAFLN